MNPLRRTVAATAAAASLILLAGCATSSGGSAPAFGAAYPQPPEGEVIAQGTVMDIGGEAELCLGPVAESYPPQCSGIPLVDWTWDGVEGSETSEETTWGAYAVQGTYNGEAFTVTAPPIMLALYDPMPFPDPTNGEPGAGDEAELNALQEELPDRLGDQYLSSSIENGYLWIDVVWDDGTLQDAADAEFGEDIVVVRSAMRELE
ncbi:hypothetical protein ABZ477_02370 [Microbacterium sp. NPDC019599]|uniref:hypothetical protein n=1 Tax=Microbacterium sp. NPDC019599 TaxID=3154690 RepID=UPI003408870F